ncbi:hypothetical protein PTRA_b0196 [Pseudoalteromonas translucida KMM 520]|uniref:Uncharacterized protein n=1 Tax=Pseudoalteromonas translucida KMM 520 TaxID=1315283 RepID=A0A0U2WS82_9GAMM|nr:hypothetical protein PTRA_b0196 [Pseudoalteromonas translucida KMM 520]
MHYRFSLILINQSLLTCLANLYKLAKHFSQITASLGV